MAYSHVSQSQRLNRDESIRRPLADSTQGHNSLSNSWATPQKRSYDYLSSEQLLQSLDGAYETNKIETSKIVKDDHKRTRGGGWPLKDSSDGYTNQPRFDRERHIRRSMSPRQTRHRPKHSRPSKFVEGSMNDRASNQPPSTYLQDNQATKEYIADIEGIRDSKDVHEIFDAGIEPAKFSGMYRFGTAVAAVFNPAMAWQRLNGIWKDKQDGQLDPQKIIMQERRNKAEKAYAELKRTGFRGTQGFHGLRSSVDLSSRKGEETIGSRPAPHRDSGVDVDGYRSSDERRRNGLAAIGNASLISPPTIEELRPASLMPEGDSGRRLSLQFRRPSLPSLKKVKSQLQLRSYVRQSTSPAVIPSIEHDDFAAESDENILRKQPSRRDLQKQQKLSKKVSDLENKLDTARRQLQQSMGETRVVSNLPSKLGAKRFKPGALPSLPSERLLNRDGISLQEDERSQPKGNAQVVRAIERAIGIHQDPVEDVKDKKQVFKTDKGEVKPEKASTTVTISKKVKSKKRKSGGHMSDDSKYEPERDDEDDEDDEWISSAHSISRTKSGKQRKSQKLEKTDSPHSTRSRNRREDKPQTHAKTYTTKALPALPRPVVSNVFDPAKVDQTKIKAMRSNPDSTVAFGRLSDDIKNLKKEFPEIANDQLVKYIATLLTDDQKWSTRARKHPSASNTPAATRKTTVDNTTITHNDIFATPLLGPPRSISSTKIGDDRAGTPPPRPPHSEYPRIAGARRYNSPSEASSHDDKVITVSPTKDGSVPAVPAIPSELIGDDKASTMAMAALETLQGGRKEADLDMDPAKKSFEWPDDVF
ncbi:hypothetical protein MMC06_005396 [Schaereria dolodes]|nr:hypothetical protein [Schaereria dolodes]